MTPKISVIIPVYNVEKYLNECLDSVCAQTLKDIEIICINDGSTDRSLEILESYAKKDKRFIILDQANQGAGIARNNGIKNAQGEFIVFMDSDDMYPTNDILETLYQKCIENDAIITGGEMSRYYDGKVSQDRLYHKKYKFEKEGFINFSDYQFNYGYTRFIYQREFLLKNNFFFPNYLRYEDPPFFINVLDKAGKFYAIPKIIYAYRVAHKVLFWSPKKVNGLFKGLLYIFNYANKKNYKELKDLVKKQFLNDFLPHIKTGLDFKNSILLFWLFLRMAPEKSLKMIGETIFSVKNSKDNRHKVITILGIKIKFKRKEKINTIKEGIIMSNKNSAVAPKVSIIVPIYNVESYLKECMDSIINQTLKDIEVICVNDGSTDGSLEILQSYAKKDKRIKIINQANGGYGKAMNTGLDNATGKYIGIVEPDDYVKLNMYEVLYNKAVENNVDFIKADFYRFIGKGTSLELFDNKLDKHNMFYNKIINPQENLKTFELIMNTWSGIYARDFIEKFHIRHNETPGASYQDNGFWFQTFALAQKIYLLNEPFYMNRRDNQNSSVNNKGNVFAMQKEYDFIRKFIEKDATLKQRLIGIYTYKKFHNYLFNYNRIAVKFRREFLKVFAKEFKIARANNEIEYSWFNENELKTLNSIMDNPTRFYRKANDRLSIWQKIFSITNQQSDKTYKIIYILGIKFRIKNKVEEFKMEMLKKYLKLESENKTFNTKLLETEKKHTSQIKELNENFTKKLSEVEKKHISEITEQNDKFTKQLSDIEQKQTLHTKEQVAKIQKLASQNKELNKKLLDSEQQYILQIQKLESQNKELNQKLLETEKKHISEITEQNDKFTKQLSDIEQKQTLHTKEQVAEIKKLEEQNIKLDNKIEIFKDQKRKSPHKFPIELKENEKDKMIQYISKSKQYLEFGSGGSTFLAKLTSDADIISVEGDNTWLEYIKEWDILDTPNINLQYVDIGKTKEWSYPIDETKKESWSDYSKKVFENKNARKSDLVLIDGRFRVACALQAILNCDDDVMIMIHDFWNREHYHILLDYLEVIDRVETLAIFKKKKNIKLNEVKKLYEKYKNITL